MDLMEQSPNEDMKPKCPGCTRTVQSIKPELFIEHVFIYVDDSNMWIEAKKLAAKQLNLKCVEDPRLRLDIGRVADVVASDRDVAWGVLYGSEPPPIDSVWEKIRERGWKVITSKRSRFTNKEKQVDHQMVADITALVSDSGVAKGKIVIVSGDADVIPAIKEGLTKKWSFEIWMWESGISKKLKSLADDNPELLTISSLDSHLKDISFTNFKFHAKQITSSLNSRSAVIKDFDFTPNEEWQKDLSEKLSWPFQYCSIGPEELESPLDYEDILLIFASRVKATDRKDFAYHFEKIFERLKQEYPGKVVNYPSYRKEYQTLKEAICLTNRFGALEDLEDIDEELSSNSLSVQGASDEDEEEARDQARDQQGPAGEGNTEHKSHTVEDDHEEFELVKRQPRRRIQQYSEQCKYRSNCGNRLRCTHCHTDAEKKFFRNPMKDKECRYKNRCKHGSRCNFAHSAKDSFCRACHDWGHLKDNCPSFPLPSISFSSETDG